MSVYVNKGDRIRARWLQLKTDPLASLAGVQLKFSGEDREVVGRVKHIRGDRPVDPQEAVLFVLPDGQDDVEVNEVQVRPEWVVEVLSAGAP